MATSTSHVTVALRTLARRPGLTASRLITIAVVTAAVSSVFAVADATFLKRLPFPDDRNLYRVYLQPPGSTDFGDANPLNPLQFERFRDQLTLVSALEAIQVADRAIAGDGEPESVLAGRVTPGFFGSLGGRLVLGRTFTAVEAAQDARVALISEGFWTRRLGRDPAAVGRVIDIDREPHTILGVLGAGFEPAYTGTDLWTPLNPRTAPGRTSLSSVQTVARLRPGVTPEQAGAEMERTVRAIERETASLKGWTAGLTTLRDAQFGSRGPALLMLLVAALGLASIATANLANLTLADLAFRHGDYATRSALGASRIDLMIPDLVQAGLLAIGGGIAGLLIARLTVPILLRLDPGSGLDVAQTSFDFQVIAFGLAVAAVGMFAAVGLPVVRLAIGGVGRAVSAGSQRAIGSAGAGRTRIVLVGAQTAIALTLLSTALVVVTSLQRASRIDPGFLPDRVVTAQLRLTEAAFPTDVDRATFVEAVVDRLRRTPGVVDAAATLNTFQAGFGGFQTAIRVEAHPETELEPCVVQYRRVSPGYFDTMRIRLRSGRAFDRHDWVDTQPVVIVSASLARRFWPGQDALGQHLKRGAATKVWSTVVGVVDDVRDVAMDDPPRDTLYSPYYQGSNAAAPVGLVVRTSGDPAGLVPAIRKAIWAVDSRQSLASVITMEEFLRASLAPQRFRVVLLAICGLVGLFLAIVGIYGVTARVVVERRLEAGVRLALGGSARHVWMALSRSSLYALCSGASAGVIGSGLAHAVVAVWLPHVTSGALVPCAIAAALLVGTGAMATFIAAHSVTSLDPLAALRRD